MAAAYWAAEYSLIRILEAEEQSREELPEGAHRPLDIVVVHTSDASTLRALRAAAPLAAELSARVHIVAPRIVPFPLALDEPQVPVSFTARQLRELADDAQVEVSVDIILCRDLMAALRAVLKPHSLIVMGGRPARWWSFGWLEHECRLAQRLRKLGHQVLSADLN
jgi:hypothetical protein